MSSACITSGLSSALLLIAGYESESDGEISAQNALSTVESDRKDAEPVAVDGANEGEVAQKVEPFVSNPLLFRVKEEVESDDEGLAAVESDDDSDVEFNRILAYTASERRKEADRECGKADAKRSRVDATGNIEHEYDHLPPLEKLSISVSTHEPLWPLGRVKSIVDCLVVVEAEIVKDLTVVDVDTVVFRSDRSVLGTVFDVLGAVRCPSYAIRFNTAQEASAAVALGEELYTATANPTLTKTVLTQKLQSERVSDDVLVLNENYEEEVMFSDDEAEREYRRSRGRGGRGSGGRGRGRGRDRGRGPRTAAPHAPHVDSLQHSHDIVDTRYMAS